MFHLFLPQMRMTPDAIVERAQAAEQAGFEGIAFMDHLAPPMAFDHDMWEAMTLASWVLAHTSTLVAGHLVLCDALRHPAVLARQATTLDHASAGRFELGIGWGSVPEELATFGVGSPTAGERVRRLGETLQVMTALWSGETVDFDGEFYSLSAAKQRPVPRGRIPLTIGGVGPKTLALVQRHADWWNVPLHEIGRLDERRPLAGDARVSVQQMVALVPSESDRASVIEQVQSRYGKTGLGASVVVGTAAELADHFRALRQRGVDRFYVWFADFAPAETLGRFAEVTNSFE